MRNRAQEVQRGLARSTKVVREYVFALEEKLKKLENDFAILNGENVGQGKVQVGIGDMAPYLPDTATIVFNLEDRQMRVKSALDGLELSVSWGSLQIMPHSSNVVKIVSRGMFND